MEQVAPTNERVEIEVFVLGDAELLAFIAEALAFEHVGVHPVPRTSELLERSSGDRRRVLIVDVERADAERELRWLRQRGYRDGIIAIGELAPELRHALDIHHVLGSYVTSKELKHALRDAVL